MNAKKPFIIGFDIGGTKILGVLFDPQFKRLAEVKARSKPQKGERNFFKTLHRCFEELLHKGGIKRSQVVGIGMGCPGLIDAKKGIVMSSPNLVFMRHLPLARRMQQLCGCPVVIGNDVNMGLFGEHQLGAARGYQHVVGIFIGTGIGGALILNGQLYGGAAGGAGEIGHMLVDPQGPLCGCGRFGCFEALCSRLSVATEAVALAARQKAPNLFKAIGTDLSEIKSSELGKAIRDGDRVIDDLVRRRSRTIGTVIGNIVNLLNPELFVLGGGLVEAMPHLVVNEATRAMQDQAMPILARRVKIVAARLGDYAVAMGAAKCAWDTFASPLSPLPMGEGRKK